MNRIMLLIYTSMVVLLYCVYVSYLSELYEKVIEKIGTWVTNVHIRFEVKFFP